MLTEKQAARLNELEWLEKAGTLTNGERIRLRELRELVEVRMHIDQVKQAQPFIGYDGSSSNHTHSFVTSTPRQTGKGHQALIDEVIQ